MTTTQNVEVAHDLQPGTLRQPLAHQQAQPLAQAAPSGAVTPMQILQMAVQQGASLEALEKLVALAERFEQREERDRLRQAEQAFNEARSNFLSENVVAIKRKTVDFTSRQTNTRTHYKHAELIDVIEAARGPASKYGLSWSFQLEQQKDWITVTCVLKHRLGYSESVKLGGPPDATGNKNAVQQITSTITMLQRQTLKANLGIAEAGEDHDGRIDPEDEGEGNGERERTPPPPPPPPPPPAGPKPYPEQDFKKNLGQWRLWIETGKKTPESIIKMIEDKGPKLSPDQLAIINEIKPKSKA